MRSPTLEIDSTQPQVPLLARRFRASPEYRLVSVAELAAPQRGRLGELVDSADVHALLHPRHGTARTKSLCRDAAALLTELVTPGLLPPSVQTGANATETIARLLLDGVLQVEWNGRYVGGPAAHPLVYGSAGPSPARGRIGRMSLDAIEYAAALRLSDPRVLSHRLYCYNRVPVTARRIAQLPDAARIEAFLGLSEPVLARRLGSRWLAVSDSDGYWRRWVLRSGRITEEAAPMHKLYISPSCDDLRDVLPVVIEVANLYGAVSFKLGRGAAGLLRPDKFVVYFVDAQRADDAACTLAERLSGVPAHGVPFTAAVDPLGLVARGIDPPRDALVVAWQGPSWRRWVTDRLALGLVDAAHLPTLAETTRFALERLRLDGVDPHTFCPAPWLWRTEHRGARA